MNNEEKLEKLNGLYAKLDKLDNIEAIHIVKKQIKETRSIMTDEDWERLMSERSEINTGRC